jgi:hypothetical protein
VVVELAISEEEEKLAIRKGPYLREWTWRRRRAFVAFGVSFMVTYISPMMISLLRASEHRDTSLSSCALVIPIPEFISL